MTTQNKLLAEIGRLKREIEANTFSKDGNNLRRNKDRLDQCKKDISLFKEEIEKRLSDCVGDDEITWGKEFILKELKEWLEEAEK